MALVALVLVLPFTSTASSLPDSLPMSESESLAKSHDRSSLPLSESSTTGALVALAVLPFTRTASSLPDSSEVDSLPVAESLPLSELLANNHDRSEPLALPPKYLSNQSGTLTSSASLPLPETVSTSHDRSSLPLSESSSTAGVLVPLYFLVVWSAVPSADPDSDDSSSAEPSADEGATRPPPLNQRTKWSR